MAPVTEITQGNYELNCRTISIWLLVSALFVASPLAAAIKGPVKTQRGGLVSGVSGSNPSITVFKGIPFAAPPVGELRRRPPQHPSPWQI